MTKQKREAIAAVRAWCKEQKMELKGAPSHVHPRSYVVGYAAPLCLVVAECWADSESQMQDFNQKYPLRTVHKFDHSLKAGDWCITAYVSTAGCGEPVAIPLDKTSK